LVQAEQLRAVVKQMPIVVACLDLDLPEFAACIRRNLKEGFEARFLTVTPESVLPRMGDVEYLIVAEAAITLAVISAFPKLKLIQSVQVGYDNIDVEAARAAGIMVANAAGVNAASVAEHTLMLMLAAARRLRDSDESVRRGQWLQLELFQKGIHDLAGKTVGIIGLGSIGRRVASYVRPLVGRIIYYKRTPLPGELEAELGVEYVSLETLLQTADVVTIHTPLTAETRGLIGDHEFSLMRPDAILINTARAAIVDEAAFVAALRDRRISAAGLDVLWNEPPSSNSEVLKLDRLLLTPHVAGASREVTTAGFRAAFDNVYRVASQQAPMNRVDDST
jgi:phosphoglycerate dehydrogenase-like enzyme